MSAFQPPFTNLLPSQTTNVTLAVLREVRVPGFSAIRREVNFLKGKTGML